MKTLIAFLLVSIAGALYAQTETTITGKLLGYDGKPMAQTDIHVYAGAGQRAPTTVHADKDGLYTLTTTDSGVVTVKFAGLCHLSEDIPFLIEKPGTIRVDVRLGTYRYKKHPAALRIMGSFNNWNMQDTREMKQESDGTFSIEFDVQQNEFSYEVSGAENTGRTINGTQSESYTYDGDGDYRSVVAPKAGKVRIVYDPSKVVRSDVPPELRFADPASRSARFTLIRWDMTQRSRERTAALMDFVDAGGNYRDFKYEKDQTGNLAKIAGQIKTEGDPLLRRWLLMSYVSQGDEKGDPEIAKMFLKDVPIWLKEYPGSQIFSFLSPYLSAAQMLGFGDEFKKSVAELLDQLSDVNMKGNMIMSVLMAVQRKNDEALMQKDDDVAVEKLAGTPWLGMIRERFAPKKTLAVGKMIPAFAVKSLEDTAIVYTSESLKGKVYMLDFWATWSGPCVAEMENLHKAYEKFKAKNFEILSFSLDAKPGDVVKFRSAKWKMPWLHAFVTTNKKVMSDFSVVAPPKSFLVDATGKIVAMQEELKGPQLEKTLVKYLET